MDFGRYPLRFIRHLVFLLCALSTTAMAKTPLPEAPIVQFKLPLFGLDGYKSWDLEGREGHFSGGESRLEVKGMRLRVYAGGPLQRLEATLESPMATIFPKVRRAEGSEYLFLTAAAYTVVGHGWSWEELGRDSQNPSYRVILHSDVRVVFKDSLERVFNQAKDSNTHANDL